MSLKKENKEPTKKSKLLGEIITINDLREKEFNQKELTPQEHLALKNFDRYRITQLNNQKTEEAFHQKYFQLQVASNLTPYQEFLKEEFFN